MTGNAGPILLITNKGRTILWGRWGGGGGAGAAMYKKKIKIFAQGKIKWKKIHARELTLKNVHATA